METLEEKVKKFAGWVAESERPVMFTGAGISTESGIPDFRGPQGVWKTTQPIMFNDFVGSIDARREYWRRHVKGHGTMANAEPNQGHIAVADLFAMKPEAHLITQNVDGLHEAAGVDPQMITEIHGNATYAKCLNCGARYELADIRAKFQEDDEPPTCNSCGGIVKTATISFGQAMPEDGMRKSEEVTVKCDLFIAIGSSLVVYPAAGFPELAKRLGAKLVIINREPTDMDPVADMVLHTEIGPTLTQTMRLVKGEVS
ncbi:MAG: Sir2 family NAD-dependent protein deacetylase [Pseudomonadota bacterium]